MTERIRSWFIKVKYSIQHVASSPQWLRSVNFLHVHHTVQSFLQKAALKFIFKFPSWGPSFHSGFHSHIHILNHNMPALDWGANFLHRRCLCHQVTAVFKDNSKEKIKNAAWYILITHTYRRTKLIKENLHQTGIQNQEHQGTVSKSTDLNSFLFITRTMVSY